MFEFSMLPPKLAAVQLDDAPDNRESQPGTSVIAACGSIHAVIAVEKLSHIFPGDPTSGIGDAHRDPPRPGFDFHMDAPARRRVAQGVLDEIFEHSLDHRDVAENLNRLAAEPAVQPDAALFGGKLKFLHQVLNEFSHGKRLASGRHLVRL